MNDRDDLQPDRCAGDAAAYVLGAFDPQEQAAFRRHAESCVVCRDELKELTVVTDVLPLAAPPQPVPRGLKRRVMAEVRAEQRGAATPRERARRAPRRLLSWPRPALTGALGALAAAAAAAVIVLGGGSGSGTRTIHASTTWTGGSATLRVSDGRAELTVARAPAPPAGHVYQVWIQRPAELPMSTNTLFSPTAGGAGTVDVPGSLHGVRQVMVTVEPAGGSKKPTNPPVVVANLT